MRWDKEVRVSVIERGALSYNPKESRITPKKEGTERQNDDFSYHLSDAFLNRRLWRFGAAHNIIMH